MKIELIIIPNYPKDLSEILEIPKIMFNLNNQIQVGPKKFFKTSFCQNVINILNRLDINDIDSFEHVKVFDINSKYFIDPVIEEIYNENSIINNHPLQYSIFR